MRLSLSFCCIGIALPLLLAPVELASAAAEPVQVFILCGQSNMDGHGKSEMGLDAEASKKAGKTVEIKGGLGSLRWMVEHDPKTFGHGGTNPLVDAEGKWIVRDDVFVNAHVNDKTTKGAHGIGFGKGEWIGPEFGFGHVVGNALDQDVLIIKVSRGGTSLAGDWRPPSAVKKRGGRVGFMWELMTSDVKTALDNIGQDFPMLANREYEIAGFGWHQGFNDAVSKTFPLEYEENLVDLIDDVRAHFGKPNLPFVIATTSMFPPDKPDNQVELAQRAVADASKHPRFKGTVATVDTGPFWRDKSISPSDFGYHWNHNGLTYYEIGTGMGKAMVKLLSSP
jgi:alpha-galactosidase